MTLFVSVGWRGGISRDCPLLNKENRINKEKENILCNRYNYKKIKFQKKTFLNFVFLSNKGHSLYRVVAALMEDRFASFQKWKYLHTFWDAP